MYRYFKYLLCFIFLFVFFGLLDVNASSYIPQKARQIYSYGSTDRYYSDWRQLYDTSQNNQQVTALPLKEP